ncbi:MAG: 23S rRNA (pseudouridine(1915)-N(3))-methyltransferase RlmH [Bdellovibrio sp.]
MLKVVLLSISHKPPEWLSLGVQDFSERLNAFCQFKWVQLKATKKFSDRHLAKRDEESQMLLRFCEPRDYVVLLDERGKSFVSLEFAKKLDQISGLSFARVVFVVGGAYGVHEDLKKRAQLIWSLSPLTFNHHLAQLVLIEQLYRCLSLNAHHPYHNEALESY